MIPLASCARLAGPRLTVPAVGYPPSITHPPPMAVGWRGPSGTALDTRHALRGDAEAAVAEGCAPCGPLLPLVSVLGARDRGTRLSLVGGRCLADLWIAGG